MHGVFIEHGLMDWQIIQHKDGIGKIQLSGYFNAPQAAVEVGVQNAHPMVRVLSENDNSTIIPWTKSICQKSIDGMNGTWEIVLFLPAGGLYRIETGLDTVSITPNLAWIFRGDVRLHIGVGDLFVIAGQSNSSGYGKDIAFDPPQLGVHLFRNQQKWDLAVHPINESTHAADSINSEMGVSGTSPYISFGKYFSSLSHYPVGLIPTALGGSPISRWDPARDGDLFYNMLNKIQSCGSEIAGILWYQGCSDTTANLSLQYYKSFHQMVSSLRDSLGYPVKFFTFQLNRQIGGINDSSWGIIREAQRQSIHTIPYVYMLSTLNCALSDSIHNSSQSNILLGENMARLCSAKLYKTPELNVPDIFQIILSTKNTLSLTFKDVTGRLTTYGTLIKESGFTVCDDLGEILIIAWKVSDNTVTLVLSRETNSSCTVSFCWEADPTRLPIIDDITYLPPFSFYKHTVIS